VRLVSGFQAGRVAAAGHAWLVPGGLRPGRHNRAAMLRAGCSHPALRQVATAAAGLGHAGVRAPPRAFRARRHNADKGRGLGLPPLPRAVRALPSHGATPPQAAAAASGRRLPASVPELRKGTRAAGLDGAVRGLAAHAHRRAERRGASCMSACPSGTLPLSASCVWCAAEMGRRK
jgi:hypothetical protein